MRSMSLSTRSVVSESAPDCGLWALHGVRGDRGSPQAAIRRRRAASIPSVALGVAVGCGQEVPDGNHTRT